MLVVVNKKFAVKISCERMRSHLLFAYTFPKMNGDEEAISYYVHASLLKARCYKFAVLYIWMAQTFWFEITWSHF